MNYCIKVTGTKISLFGNIQNSIISQLVLPCWYYRLHRDRPSGCPNHIAHCRQLSSRQLATTSDNSKPIAVWNYRSLREITWMRIIILVSASITALSESGKYFRLRIFWIPHLTTLFGRNRRPTWIQYYLFIAFLFLFFIRLFYSHSPEV